MNNKNTKEIVMTGMVWKFGERFLAQGVSFAVSVVLARLLAPSDYGLIAMVLIFISIADCFVSSGFPTALIQKKDPKQTDYSTMFYCSLLASMVVYGILFFFSSLYFGVLSGTEISHSNKR